jgi:hypothetical protein
VLDDFGEIFERDGRSENVLAIGFEVFKEFSAVGGINVMEDPAVGVGFVELVEHLGDDGRVKDFAEAGDHFHVVGVNGFAKFGQEELMDHHRHDVVLLAWGLLLTALGRTERTCLRANGLGAMKFTGVAAGEGDLGTPGDEEERLLKPESLFGATVN